MKRLNTAKWDELAFNPVGLWRHLLRHHLPMTAFSLLQDLMELLIRLEARMDEAKHNEEGMCDMDELGFVCAEAIEMSVASFREQMMEILGDGDGSALARWKKLYGDYRVQRIPSKTDPFIQAVHQLMNTEGKAVAKDNRDDNTDAD
jgi:hypothetical protein